jgi:hypothetical protein
VYGLGLSSQPEAAVEENGELGFRHAPLAWRHLSLFLHLPQDQEQELERTLVGGKVPAGSHRPAQFGIQRLDGVGRIDVSPEFPPLRAGVRWLIDARC